MENLKKFHKSEQFINIYQKVQWNVSSSPVYDKVLQIPEMKSTLRKKLFITIAAENGK
jgi:hypothetical protein